MSLSSVYLGRKAEKTAADYLVDSGYKIINTNWRTKRCEIDIIAVKDGAVYFVEVKFRSENRQGNGFEYITKRKLKQMQYAAKSWIACHHWHGVYYLSALSVYGEELIVEFIEQI